MGTELSDLMEKNYLSGKPFSYLLNMSEFYNHSFFVDKRVLIPRSETELLVDLILKMKDRSFKKILDVGVGSGVIILSLLIELPEAKGVGVDISPKALAVAQLNAKNLRLSSRVEFLLSDRLEKIHDKFDLIVSNPPYIKESSHRHLVQSSVDKFEPSMALYLNDVEYETWFGTFFQQIKSSLNSGGVFMMEGHELEVTAQAKKLTEIGFKNVKVLNDWGGSCRYLQAEI